MVPLPGDNVMKRYLKVKMKDTGEIIIYKSQIAMRLFNKGLCELVKNIPGKKYEVYTEGHSKKWDYYYPEYDEHKEYSGDCPVCKRMIKGSIVCHIKEDHKALNECAVLQYYAILKSRGIDIDRKIDLEK